MSRCSCTSRALELFVRDLAGLQIQRPAPRIARHPFSTRPPRRQLQTAIADAGVEDGFIPFDFQRSPIRDDTKTGESNEGAKKGNHALEAEPLSEEWHAEIEIQSAWPARTSGAGIDNTGLSTSGGQDLVAEETAGLAAARNEPPVDNVALPVPPTSHPVRGDASLRVPRIVDASARPPSVEVALVRSKAENRLARKQRRILAGAWGPRRTGTGTESVQEITGGDETASVLRQIEALPGPAVGGKKKQQTKKGEETKSAQVKTDTGKKGPSKEEAEPSGQARSDKRAKTQAGNKKDKATAAPSKDNKDDHKSSSKAAPQEIWRTQKAALAAKFGVAGWDPSKKLSPDTMNGVRALHASDPTTYTTARLAQHFEVSPENIRRILKSKWRPDEAQAERRRVAWERRGVRKWEDMAAKGIRPPKVWRERGVEWERKSRSRALKSKGLRSGRPPALEVGMEEGVGMLGGIGDGIEDRI